MSRAARTGRLAGRGGAAALVALACAGPASAQDAVSAEDAGGFVERAAELGLVHSVMSGWDDLGSGAKIVRDWVQTGLALGDVDGDGDLDVVACGGPLPSALLLQQSDGTFAVAPSSAAIQSGELCRAPALGDYDRDGDLDLYLGVFEGVGTGALTGRGRLFDNDGSGQFDDVTALAGVRGRGRTLHAQWIDLDLDGWLDLYLSEFALAANAVYRNNADGSFTDVGATWAIDDAGSTHATAILDSDDNGWPDLFVGNDHYLGEIVDLSPNEPDAVLMGVAPGVFTDASEGSGAEQARGIMGIALGDVDYDGDLDLYKTDVGANWLLINHGWPQSGLHWTNEAGLYGVRDALLPFPDEPTKQGMTSGWATAFVDVDLDRWVDLWVVNGHVAGINDTQSYLPRDQANSLYRSLGPEGAFHFEQANGALGLLDHFDDRAGAAGDVDGDGDIDFLVAPTVGPLRYYQNQLDRQGRGFLHVTATAHTSAPRGAGAVVRWTASDGIPHLRALGGTAPTASQDELGAHFGLGLEASADVDVEFPSGVTITTLGVLPDTRLAVVEPELFELSSTKVAAACGPEALPTQLTVRVHAHDATGAELDASTAVSIELPGATAATAVVNEGGNVFSRVFDAPAAAGAYRVQVTIDGWTPRVAPVVHAVGPVDPARTAVYASTVGVRAGTSDEVCIDVTPRDADGVALGPGRTVSVALGAFLPLTEVADLGNGAYRRVFQAPRSPGVAASVVRVDGVGIPATPLVDAAGPADSAASTVKVFVPKPPQAAAPDTIKLRITPRDAAQRHLGGSAAVELILHSALELPADTESAPGSPQPTAPASPSAAGVGPAAPAQPSQPPTLRVVAGLTGLPREDGSYLFVVERLPSAPENAAGTVEIVVDGATVGSIPIAFP